MLRVPRYVPQANSNPCLLCSAQNAVVILFMEEPAHETDVTGQALSGLEGVSSKSAFETVDPFAAWQELNEWSGSLMGYFGAHEVFVEWGGLPAGGTGGGRGLLRIEIRRSHGHEFSATLSDPRRNRAAGLERIAANASPWMPLGHQHNQLCHHYLENIGELERRTVTRKSRRFDARNVV